MTSTAAPEGPALEHLGNNSARAGQSHDHPDRRADRWEARGVLWRESRLRPVAWCGRYPLSPIGEVHVRRTAQAVGYAGLRSCGSVWACPVCNARVQAVRRLEVGVGLAHALHAGGAAFGAYTVRHHAGMGLDPLWRSLSYCWNGVATDKLVRRLRSDLGHVGVLRAAEVTHGSHGWHPHLHPVHVFSRPVSDLDVERLHREQVRAWTSAAKRKGLDALPVAQHLHRVTPGGGEDLGEYFTKTTWAPDSVGWEVTSTQTKTTVRAEGRTPWQLLNAVHRDGDADALALWHAWEQGSHRKRALTWSRGLRSHLGLDAERSDEEIAAAEVGTRDDVGLVVTDWSAIQAAPRLGGRLLSAIHAGGWDAGVAFATEHHIPHRRTAA